MASGSSKNPLKAPRWDLSTVYAGFSSPKYKEDTTRFKQAIKAFSACIDDERKRSKDPALWLTSCIRAANEAYDLYEELSSFVYSVYSTDTRNEKAQREINALEALELPLKRANVSFRNSLKPLEASISSLTDDKTGLSEYRFFLEEELFFQRHQMSPAEEDIAADLSRSGGDAWTRLQEAVSSTLAVPWDEASGEKKTVNELRGLAFHEDRAIRRKAYEKELQAWKLAEIPLAFAINGVKGFSVSLNRRRLYENTLMRSVAQARINGKTLESLIAVMKESLPVFRKYLKGKAKLLSVPRLAFYDLFAPVGTHGKIWTFAEAQNFIVRQFSLFSKEYGSFAEKAFHNSWIDAEIRPGKVGGAYCTSFPKAKESRILCNFDGSFSSIITLAHELGHAYHHEVLKETCAIHRNYPMTLAETASIFSESLIYDGALMSAKETEKLGILETFLQDATQVIVDILSRYLFEQAVLKEREKGDLSPERLCRLMIRAQKETYGEALDGNRLHPYMWAVKGHYYHQDLAFFFFFYAFGQLFGLGLFSLYKKQGRKFCTAYKELLGKTGKASAVEVVRQTGFSIEEPDFWRQGIDMIREKVEEFLTLSA